MFFRDRDEAGRKLAELLPRYVKRKDVIVLGIPRGGIPVAFQVAKALDAPLDIFLSRKLGVPGQEELAFGAVASGDTIVLDREIVEAFAISDKQIAQIAGRVKTELERRESLYRGDRPALKIPGMTVLLVDDGIATGSSMLAAVQALRQMKPAEVVVAVPVAPEVTCNRLRSAVDALVCVYTPSDFWGIGQFYEDFSQLSDDEVTRRLRCAAQSVEQSTLQSAPPDAERTSR
jgi:putative phosphoribosyl transferase